jgi:hypothetical protein
MTVTASDARRRGFLPPLVLGAVLVMEKASLSWQRFEG